MPMIVANLRRLWRFGREEEHKSELVSKSPPKQKIREGELKGWFDTKSKHRILGGLLHFISGMHVGSEAPDG